jgi:hypothetical protein
VQLDYRIDTTAAARALKDLDRAFDRATMYGLRAAGRSAKQVGRRNAPVYSGDDPRVPPGRLKESIHSAKKLRKVGDREYVLQVAPFGGRVKLYRSRVDGGEYMRMAYEDAAGQMATKFAAAYTRTLRKAGVV